MVLHYIKAFLFRPILATCLAFLCVMMFHYRTTSISSQLPGHQPGQIVYIQGAMTQHGKVPEFAWKQSLPIRSGDPEILPIGGTETRALVAFDGKLFAATGYWMDTAKNNPALPGAQVLRLDGPGATWQVDLQLNDRNPRGLRLYQAISTIEKVRFTTDDEGKLLTIPVEFLLAGVWKRGPGLDVFARMAGSDSQKWSKTQMPGQESAPAGTQVRSFILHKDNVTGIDMLFAGITSAVVLPGKYDSKSKSIIWNRQTEL
jgi:hypothetical protein